MSSRKSSPLRPQCLRRLHPQRAQRRHDAREQADAEHPDPVQGEVAPVPPWTRPGVSYHDQTAQQRDPGGHDVFALIVDSARGAGFLREVKGQQYVDLDAGELDAGEAFAVSNADVASVASSDESNSEPGPRSLAPAGRRNTRVFITHGKNQEVVGQRKDLLTFGGFTPVVAIETESVSKPVPDKVMDDMRACGAAVIHVGGELRLMDPEGRETRMLNQNVLIEIGAAMALFGRNFILLVEKGTTLPSNLQGLYEVRYDGGRLDYDATMKLLKAFNDFRS